MAVAANALTSLTNFKEHLGNTSASDAFLERIINRASEMIITYCNRVLLKTTYSNEEYDGTDDNELMLDNYPVDTAQTFTLQHRNTLDNQNDWSTIDSQNYFIDDDEGVIRRVDNDFIEGIHNYRVSYTAGYHADQSDVPEDLEQACLEVASYLFNNRRRAGIVSETVGDVSQTFNRTTAGKIIRELGLDQILDAYRETRL